MINKIFIGLFAVILAACGCFGYYTYHLSDQVNTLNDAQLVLEQDLATARGDISDLNTDLAAFKTNTANNFATTQGQITRLGTQFEAFQTETNNQLTTLQTDLANTNTNLADLQKNFSEAAMNVRALYDKAVKSVCMVTTELGQGSGFVYSADGYVVTCWHVIKDATRIFVTLYNGRLVTATVVGSDNYADIAVLKLSPVSGLTALTLADSGALTGGEPVMVVGNPYGIFETVTYGVVSQLNAMVSVTGFTWMVSNLIQIDAPTNPGNSGGPAINKDGEVIGIMAYGFSEAEGIHYAIASNRIERIADAIISHGTFLDATLPGTYLALDLNPLSAFALGLSTSFGVWFASVDAVGDLAYDDVVVGIDGNLIRDMAGLFSYIGEFKSPNDKVTLMVIRKNVQISIDVYLTQGFIPVSG